MTKDGFLYSINKFCAVFLVIWVCWPWFGQNTGLIGGVFFAAGWCATAVVINNRYVVGNDGILMMIYVINMMLSYILNGRTYGEFPFYYYISMVALFFLPYYMTKFYIGVSDNRFMGKLAVVAVVFMIVGSLTSSYYTAVDPNIMKTISQNTDQ